MIVVKNKKNCCGCSACEQSCPVQAIQMTRDKIGFEYPVIDQTTCINCGLCEKTCPIINEQNSRIPNHVYAVKNKNTETRLASSSGGVFSILAQEILENKGIVYGAAFDDNWNVHHTRIDSTEKLHLLQGSKYVQSKIGIIYKQVKTDLINGKKVLFSGTPCQIAALQNFLKKKYTNLITVDVACHGVPNPRIWEDFLNEQAHSRSEIKNISFRDKSTGWNTFSFLINISNKQHSQKAWEHVYMLLFLHNFILRPSCHKCHFRNGKSGADFTISDYWAIERNYPNFADDKGVSALITYNQEIPPSVVHKSEYIETKYDDLCFGNPVLKESHPKNKDAWLFYLLHDKVGFSLNRALKFGLILMNTRLFVQKKIGIFYHIVRKLLSYVKWQK